MADMHVLTKQGEKHRIACHIAIPNTNNPAGVNYRTALVRAGLSTPTSVLPDGDGTGGTIAAAEKTSLGAGALIERVLSLDITQGGTLTTLAQINAYVDAWYAQVVTETQGELQAILAQFGRTR
jgi:hypothetical protein